MGQGIDWSSLPKDERRKRWKKLSKEEQAHIWKTVNAQDRGAIIRVNDTPVEELIQTTVKNVSLPKPKTEDQIDEQDEPLKAEYAKFELHQVHRERLEIELGALRKSFDNYSKANQRRSHKRRAENIYILVALGIIGGYLSYNPNLIFRSLLDIVGLSFTIASGLFILIKIITVRIANLGQDTRWSILDDRIDTGFAVILTGVFVLGSASIIVNAFNISITRIGELVLMALIFVAMLIQLKHLLALNKARDLKSTHEMHTEIMEELFQLPDNSNKDQKTEEILKKIKKLADSTTITSWLVDLNKKVEKIDGIPKDNVDSIQALLDKLIEQKENEEKSEAELREEKIIRLEEKKEELLSTLRE